jgi:hypothetical protein
LGEWLSTPGPGFNGFHKIVITAVSMDWSIVGSNPPVAPSAAASPAAMAHAMAAMGAHSAAPVLPNAVAPPAAVHPMLAAPGLATA